MNNIIEKIVGEVGSKSEIAKNLGITKGAVSQWNRVPPKHAVAVSAMTNGKVSVIEILNNKLAERVPNQKNKPVHILPTKL